MILDKRDFYQRISGDWKGTSDLWVEAKFVWDKDYLYIHTKVIDDIFSNDYPADGIWQGDSIQFAIAPQDRHKQNEPFVQIDIAKAKGQDTVYRRAFGMQLKEGIIEFKGGIKVEGNRVVYLIAIPWKELGIKPKSGDSYGFSFLV
ncbi:MAG: hypothetical protein H5T69_21640, partial [Chloroflexi bacterium]|nr:hypothetical protein [Chloroflexota bacterium]